MNGYCCDNDPYVKAEYNGGVMGNDVVFVCKYHLTRHPWNKFILSKEFIKNKKNRVPAREPRPKNTRL